MNAENYKALWTKYNVPNSAEARSQVMEQLIRNELDAKEYETAWISWIDERWKNAQDVPPEPSGLKQLQQIKHRVMGNTHGIGTRTGTWPAKLLEARDVINDRVSQFRSQMDTLIQRLDKELMDRPLDDSAKMLELTTDMAKASKRLLYLTWICAGGAAAQITALVFIIIEFCRGS